MKGLLEVDKARLVPELPLLLPCPSLAPVMASLALPKPSSRHTTLADTRFQLSSQTVPHSPFFSTSTRPSPVLAPPFSLTSGCWKTQTEEGFPLPGTRASFPKALPYGTRLQASCGPTSVTLRYLKPSST